MTSKKSRSASVPTVKSSVKMALDYDYIVKLAAGIKIFPNEPISAIARRSDPQEYSNSLTSMLRRFSFDKHETTRNADKLNPKESRSDWTTLKMDVSFADHSFVIGRQGRNIKNIMSSTNTQIHFPDSNRNNRFEKSNQVSIKGVADNVLRAREKIRDILPVSFLFYVSREDLADLEQKYKATGSQLCDKLNLYLDTLQNEHNMTIGWAQVSFECVMVTVRGRRNNFSRIKEGFARLTEFLFPLKLQPSVYLGIEVSPHYLDFVRGPDDLKLNYIQNSTNTDVRVVFQAQSSAYAIPTILIYGQLVNVFEAWSTLMDFLPVAVLIEIPEQLDFWQQSIAKHGKGVSDTQEGSADEIALSQPESAWLPSSLIEALNDSGQFSASECTEENSSSGAEGEAVKDRGSIIATMMEKINDMLYDYDISLVNSVAPTRIVVRGPECYAQLLMDIREALMNPRLDPVTHLYEALIRAGQPIRFDCIQIESPGSSPASSVEWGNGSSCRSDGGFIDSEQASSSPRQEGVPERLSDRLRSRSLDYKQVEFLRRKSLSPDLSTAYCSDSSTCGSTSASVTLSQASSTSTSRGSSTDSSRFTISPAESLLSWITNGLRSTAQRILQATNCRFNMSPPQPSTPLVDLLNSKQSTPIANPRQKLMNSKFFEVYSTVPNLNASGYRVSKIRSAQF